MPDRWDAPEYVAARRALLDVLELLTGQRAALVLVGAQAVYLHAPGVLAHHASYTTDSDLVIDPDLLAETPDVADVLTAAGYTTHSSPGTFYSPDGIPVDLMVPDRALPPPSRRTAVLPGQSAATARRTAGLELALIDAEPTRLAALDPADTRTVTIPRAQRRHRPALLLGVVEQLEPLGSRKSHLSLRPASARTVEQRCDITMAVGSTTQRRSLPEAAVS